MAPPLVVHLKDEAATGAFAQSCAAIARAGDVVALAGALGAGKTAFARAFINAIARRNDAPPEEVPSPTFTLVQIYEFTRDTVWHFDLYRIDGPDRLPELGLDDAFADGISLVEWPDRLGVFLPPDRLELDFSFGAEDRGRDCGIVGHGAWADRVKGLIERV